MLAKPRIQRRKWEFVGWEWLGAFAFRSHLEEFFKTPDRPLYGETNADQRAYLEARRPKLLHHPWCSLET